METKNIKPSLIAIVGKSASGKDYIKNQYIKNGKIKTRTFLISDTTRPKRPHEIDGKDYNFISEERFLDNIDEYKYLEYTCFRGWYYGHSVKELSNILTNVGIFDPAGIQKIIEDNLDDNFFNQITIIYIKAPLIERLKRSKQREGKWKLEFFRRAFTDWKDFREFDNFLKHVKLPENIRIEEIDNS